MLKNFVEPDMTQITMYRMRSACWILKSTNTLRIITACPRQQCLRERASMLRHTYIAHLVLVYTQNCVLTRHGVICYPFSSKHNYIA